MGIHFPKDPCLANNIVIPIQHEVCYRYCRRRCCLQRFGPGWGHQVCPTPEGVRGPGSQAGGDGIRRNWIIWNGKPWTNHWTEQVGHQCLEKGLAAGYKGLAALTALADGDFAKAQQYGNEANNMLPDSTSLGFLSDFGFGDSATADNIATKAAATIVSQQPAQPAKVVASPVVRTILNTAQNPVYYSGYQGYTRPTYTTSYLVPTASATQYAAYY